MKNTKEKQNFLSISCRVGSGDFLMFQAVWNIGIDSRLRAFTKSTFDVREGRLYLDFHYSEIEILVYRLEDLGTDDALMWIDDIQTSLGGPEND
jgi:hypothetical protein